MYFSTDRSELKVFTDLASISAGENDLEIDRLRNFQDAVIGYSPLLYSLHETAGFEEFLALAQEVWDALQKDEKLPEKLVLFFFKIRYIDLFLRTY